MDMTEKSGQPSMEEILASIRRIIAEEPADAISLDFKPRLSGGHRNLDLDDNADFELPSMFRASSSPANGSDKSAQGSGKLMDALRATPQLDTVPGARHEALFPLPANFHDMTPNSHTTPVQTNSLASALSGLSSLRPTARGEPPASELFGRNGQNSSMPAVETVTTEHSGWAVETPLAADSPEQAVFEANAPVVRQMVPFRDQHFTRMQNLSAPVPAVKMPEPPVATAPPQAPQPPSFATLAFNSATPPPLTPPAGMQSANPSAPQQYLNGVQRAPDGAGPIEDATAELLRPMLRQWLSENMPRMVEKALHIEVAESAKPAKKPGSI